MRPYYLGVAAIAVLVLSACSKTTDPNPAAAAEPPCTPTGMTVYGGSDKAHPLDPVVVNLPSDSDNTAVPAPTPQTNIYLTVMVPQGCPNNHFPVVLNAPGWGLTRFKNAAKDPSLDTTGEMFIGLMELIPALPYYGYVVISFDERGMGESVPAHGGGNARVIDPALETQDARAVLDWAYDHADTYQIKRETGTGIDKDIKVGTIGVSYGSGFQLPLAALDKRVDALVPAGSWHDLAYSLMPGDAVKLNWAGTLCTAATLDMKVTPVLQTLCNTVGGSNPDAINVRSLSDVLAATLPPATPQPRALTSKEELLQLFYSHAMNYFEDQQDAHQDWLSLDTHQPFEPDQGSSVLRSVPVLFLQGNRDVLFNLTEGYWNWRYFHDAGGDVRLLSNEGGHINPLVGQKGLAGATPACGTVDAVDATLAWFNHYLKGIDSANFSAIPKVCVSVVDTATADTAKPVGVNFETDMPVGSLSGGGAVPTQGNVPSTSFAALAADPVFVKIGSAISGNDKVIAGAGTIASITVTAGEGATQDVNAFVGVGIRRGGQLILVDDQVTPFTQGTHTGNHTVDDEMPSEDPDRIWLPAVGEQLQDGDEVGLLFYRCHPQYLPLGKDCSNYTNPYSVVATDVELPILIPGTYPGSSLSK
jgi:pimeloyl-ACP methyl ester carboxylesterase